MMWLSGPIASIDRDISGISRGVKPPRQSRSHEQSASHNDTPSPFRSRCGAGFAASLLDQGDGCPSRDDAAKAKSLLLAALNQNPQDERAYLYLGIADMQLGDYSAALEQLKAGLTVSQQYTYAFYFDIGNIYFIQGQNTLAEGMYSLAIQKDPSFADAFLNRANARMRLQSYEGPRRTIRPTWGCVRIRRSAPTSKRSSGFSPRRRSRLKLSSSPPRRKGRGGGAAEGAPEPGDAEPSECLLQHDQPPGGHGHHPGFQAQVGARRLSGASL